MPWSLSRLKTYEQCHAKYNYQYIDKLDRGSPGPAAERGIRIHKEIEDAIAGGTALPATLGASGTGIAGNKSAGVLQLPEYQIFLDREWEQIVVGDHWYHGILDLVEKHSETEVTIWDWKTGKVYLDHDQQKALYSLVIFSIWPDVSHVRTNWAYLDQKKVVVKEYFREPAAIALAKADWEFRVAMMEANRDKFPNPQFLCRYCNYSKSKGGPCPM